MTFFTVSPRDGPWPWWRSGEVTCGFDDDLRADRGPIELGRIALGVNLDLFPIDGDEVVAGDDFVFDVAENRIVLEKMGEDCRTGEVVDGNEIDFRVTQSCAKDVSANAAEAVYANLDCHVVSLLRSVYDLLCTFRKRNQTTVARISGITARFGTRRGLPPNSSDYHCCQQEVQNGKLGVLEPFWIGERDGAPVAEELTLGWGCNRRCTLCSAPDEYDNDGCDNRKLRRMLPTA